VLKIVVVFIINREKLFVFITTEEQRMRFRHSIASRSRRATRGGHRVLLSVDRLLWWWPGRKYSPSTQWRMLRKNRS
jgi:hypothetical protein